MLQLVIDYGSSFAFILLSLGIYLQARKVRIRGSLSDIAVSEVLMRFIASSIVYIKILTLKDIWMSVGHGTLITCHLYYISTLFYIKWTNRGM